MDAPPFPSLSAGADQRIQLLQGEAAAALIGELKNCWLSCIASEDAWSGPPTPRPRHDPAAFFPPFLKYGVALFDTFPQVWLELDPKPDLSDFLAWVKVPLQVRIAEEIAPYWPVVLADKEVFNVPTDDRAAFPVSLWERYMGISWDRITRDVRMPLEPAAMAIIRTLRSGYRDAFADALMVELAERADHWSLEGLRRLRAPTAAAEAEDRNASGGERGDDSAARAASPRPRISVDERHRKHADLLESVLVELRAKEGGKMGLAVARWLSERHDQSVTDTDLRRYRRGWEPRLIGKEKRAAIEAEIAASAIRYGVEATDNSTDKTDK